MKYKAYIFLLVILTAISCSTRKNTFINRNFHALTTKYNVLFNGEQAFEKGLKEIRKKHIDNYLKILPVEPITFQENKIQIPIFKSKAKGKQQIKNETPPFEKAEEKAVKAIQKHSMNIGGFQRNKQIDEAYFLLGKARYYTQRFVPAIDAFRYIIVNYPNSNLTNQTKIWRAKANIRIENEQFAIRSLKLLLRTNKNAKNFSDQIKNQIHTILAMAYLKIDSTQQVIIHLRKAIKTHENREQTARNMFILGQLYHQQNKKDSATIVFQKLVDFKKAPYKYRIHANIELAKNTSKNESLEILIHRFKKLIKNRDNRPYLDKLYYYKGVLEKKQGNLIVAINDFKKSLKTKNGSNYQKTFAYEQLGNIKFNKGDFLSASSYYDSVLQNAKNKFKNELRIRRIKRKHKGLAFVTKYETIVKVNDSILMIANMSKEKQKQYFKKYIEKLKKEDQKKSLQKLNLVSFGAGEVSISSKKNKAKWYFYNLQSVQFGEVEFQKVWGNRPLQDNWRLSDKTIITNASKNTKNIESKFKKRYELATYLDAVPKNKKMIDALTNQRNNALYQLGLIYKEQFKNPKLAIYNLTILQKVNTDKKLTLPINYHLYQVYTSIGNVSKAYEYKNIILKKYPNTKYSKIILFPNKKLEEKTTVNQIENKYKELYYLYKKNKFQQVVKKINGIFPTVLDSPLVAKFQLLKAYAIRKFKVKEEFIKALEFVYLNYANTKEAQKAKKIIEQLK